DADYFTQPGDLFRLMKADEQQRLFDNTARAMQGVERHIKLRHIKHCYLADPAYGAGLAKAVDLPLAEALACHAEEQKKPAAFCGRFYSSSLIIGFAPVCPPGAVW